MIIPRQSNAQRQHQEISCRSCWWSNYC